MYAVRHQCGASPCGAPFEQGRQACSVGLGTAEVLGEVYRPCGPELTQGHRVSRPRGTGSVGDSVGEGLMRVRCTSKTSKSRGACDRARAVSADAGSALAAVRFCWYSCLLSTRATHIHIYIYTYIHIYIYTYVHMYIYTYSYILCSICIRLYIGCI